jgi:flavin-dependent dehydrogenase
VYEQAERLEPAARTLIVTADLNRALGFVPTSAIVNRVPRFEFRSNGTLARLELNEPDLIVERAELVRLLAGAAAAAGAEIKYGYRFAAIESDGARTVASFEQRGSDRVERVVACAVVGADGAPSAVARALGQPARPTTSVMQARVALPDGADGGLSQVWFAPRDTRYFYWLVPESPRFAAVGLVHDDPQAARPTLDRFLRNHNFEPLEYQAARIPMYEPSPHPHGQVGQARVYLVGDAGGQVKVTTVGGTVSGLQGARAAARSISRECGYHRAHWPLNTELITHWLIRRVWNRFGEEDYSALLRSMNARVRSVLQACNRDRWFGAVFPVLAARPALLALAARTAARGW